MDILSTTALAILFFLVAVLWWAGRPKPLLRRVHSPPPPKSDYTLVREAEVLVDPRELESVRQSSSFIVEPLCDHEHTQFYANNQIVCASCGKKLGKIN